MPENLPDLAALTARSEATLIEFLNAELALGLTFLRIAETENGLDAPHSALALKKARTAFDSVNHFQERIQDPTRRGEMQTRAALLAAIDAFQSSTRFNSDRARRSGRCGSGDL
jgi:hypothetical protein